MGSILINIPDFADDELIFDEAETRLILKFFWPTYVTKIDKIEISNDVRRVAQSALVAAIDGSHAMGYMHILGITIARPHSSIRSLVTKLVRRSSTHWWKYAKQRDLSNALIYDTVKNRVAQSLRSAMSQIFEGIALKRGRLQFYALVHQPLLAWG